MSDATLLLDGERLLQIARDTGLRHHLRAVDSTAAGELLTRFAAAVISAHTPKLLDAVDGAIAFGTRGVNAPTAGHWLQRFWDIGRGQVAVRDQALQEAAAKVDARYSAVTGSQGYDKGQRDAYDVAESDILALKGTPAAAHSNEHIDDDAVDHFAVALKDKLADARKKGRSRWFECDPADLSRMLREHVEKGDPRDVANFCMFLWSLGRPIAPAAAVEDAQPDLRSALDALVREAQAVADDYHNPRYTRLDEAIQSARLALSAPQPSTNPGPLAAVERQAIIGLLNLAYAAHIAAEDSMDDDNPDFIQVDKKAMEKLTDALDVVEALPDDCPGYALGGSATAKWALRRLFGCTTMTELDAAIAASKEGAKLWLP